MDLLLSLLCGALGGLAIGGVSSRSRMGQPLAAGLGLVGGWCGSRAMDYFAIGLSHTPAPTGVLDPSVLALHIAATAGTGAALVAALGQLRRLRRR